MLNSAIRISLIISGLAILLASCQTTITTTTVPTRYKLVNETIEPIRQSDEYTIVRDTSNDVHLLRYGESRENDRIKNDRNNGQLVFQYDREHAYSNGYGTFSEGKADIGSGFIHNIYTFTDKDDPELYADLVTLRGGGYFLEVGGDRFVSIPRGRLTYTGTNIFAVEGEFSYNNWGRGASDGDFEMTVDFDAGTGNIEGATPTFRSLDGSEIYGRFGVNTERGTFSGSALTVENVVTGQLYDTEILGSFHGRGAHSVTGIYKEDRTYPRFFGAIVGYAPD